MEAYTSFAYVYDTFMDNVPYGEWARHIREKLCEHGVTDGIVLDLGCGTGTMTERLAGLSVTIDCFMYVVPSVYVHEPLGLRT